MSAAIHTWNSKLQRATASGGPFTDVGEVVSIGGPSVDVSVVEVTHLASPSRAKEFIAGLIDPGEFEFEANFLKADFNTLWGDCVAGTSRWFKVIFSDTSSFLVNGFFKTLKPNTAGNDRHMYTASIKITGLPTYTPAA